MHKISNSIVHNQTLKSRIGCPKRVSACKLSPASNMVAILALKPGCWLILIVQYFLSEKVVVLSFLHQDMKVCNMYHLLKVCLVACIQMNVWFLEPPEQIQLASHNRVFLIEGFDLLLPNVVSFFAGCTHRAHLLSVWWWIMSLLQRHLWGGCHHCSVHKISLLSLLSAHRKQESASEVPLNLQNLHWVKEFPLPVFPLQSHSGNFTSWNRSPHLPGLVLLLMLPSTLILSLH